jgi:Ca2+-binding RTX toxin-like protein
MASGDPDICISCPPQPTQGDDIIRGYDYIHNFKGLGGNDIIEAGNGNDILAGNNGSDDLYGGGGEDILKGGRGNDWLIGGQGDDVLFGGAGHDYLEGGDGNDILYGSNRSDYDGDSDLFAFDNDDGSDQVRKFEIGLDKIALLDGGSASFVYDGTNTTMTYGLTTVIFKGVQVSDADVLI